MWDKCGIRVGLRGRCGTGVSRSLYRVSELSSDEALVAERLEVARDHGSGEREVGHLGVLLAMHAWW